MTTNGVAVDAGHHHVEEDQVGFLRLDEVERLQAVARGHDLVAPRDEHRLQQAHVLRHVVDDEDLCGPVTRDRSALDDPDQLDNVDGLGEIAVEPDVEETLAVASHRLRGQRDHRNRAGSLVSP